MKRKILSVFLTLVLVCSFSLVTAAPVSAQGAVGLGIKAPGATAEWSTTQVDAGTYSVHLDTGTTTDGNEGRIVIDAASVGITTLSDITSIAWSVYTVAGYPPHVDIYLDVDEDTVVDPEDVLTVELHGTNNADPVFEFMDMIAKVNHGTWLKTFELASGDGYGAVGDTSEVWLSKLGGGPGDAPFGTLAQWKAGQVGGDPQNEITVGVIDGNAPVLRLEIEIDRWMIDSEAYVDDVIVNTTTYELELPAARPLTVDDDREDNPDAYFQTIQGAIDCAIADETINVAAGTYNERVNINKSLTVSSVEGAELTTIDAQGLEFGVLIHGTGTVATFDGFTVGNYQRVGILAGSFSLAEEDPDVVHILNNIVTEPITQENNNCIQISAGTTGTVIGNEVMGASLESPDWTGSGILVAGSSDVLVSNNYAHDCESGIVIVGYAVYREAPAEDNLIKNNLVEDSGTGIAIQMNSIGTIVRYNDVLNNDGGIVSVGNASFEPTIPSGTQVHYNNIVGNVNYGVKSLVWQPGVPEQLDAEKNWWGDAVTTTTAIAPLISGAVDYSPWLVTSPITGTAPNIVASGHPWTWYTDDSIQDAIVSATEGDTIGVAAGTYDEQVVIDKALMLQGMGDATVIQPSGPDKLTSLYTLGNQDGAYWNLQKLASIIEVSGVGTASVTVKDLKVDGVNIDSTGVPYIVGISYGETGGTIDDVTVVNMDTTGVTSSDRTYGIWLDAVTTAVSVEVKESTITLYNKNGINARGAELTVDIHDNTITGPGESPCVPNGILLINGAEGTVGPDNTITNHGYTGQWTACGIATWDVAGVIIEGNPISACGSGIGLSGNPAASQGTTDTIIRENTITGTERGVYLECPDTTNNTITGNDIQGNEYGIYLAGPESPTYDELESVGPGNVAYFNDIMGNTEYGVVNFNPEVSFEATRNYWGHASGPAHELPNDKNDKWVGKGDKVSENVDYKPWLHKSEEGVVDEKKPAYAQSVDLDNTGEYGWNTFSAPIFLDEEADTWAELVDLTDLDYNPAYRFDSDNQTFVLLTTTDNYTITPGEGFFIKMNDVGSLTILYSTAWNPTPPTRPLTAGWNLIGLANLEEMDVDVAFASIAEAPGLAGYSQVVNPIGNAESGPVFAGGTIYVGESYWVYMLGERTLAGFTMTPVKWVP